MRKFEVEEVFPVVLKIAEKTSSVFSPLGVCYKAAPFVSCSMLRTAALLP